MKNRRLATLILMAVALVFLSAVTASGYFWKEAALATDFSRKDLSPSIAFLFGTDWMGRDMFVRTIVGLSLSIRIGLLTAAASAVLAFLMGTAGILGSGGRRFPDPLDVAGAADPGRGAPAEREQLHPDRREAWPQPMVHRVPPHGALPFPSVCSGAGPFVPSCDPPRSQYNLPGLRPFSGAAGDRSDPVRKHAVSGYGKMVAGPVSGDPAVSHCPDVPFHRTGARKAGKSGKRPGVRRTAYG